MAIAVSVLLAVLCLVPASGKLLGHPKMQASAAHFGIAWPRYRLIGVAEFAAAVGVLAGLAARPLGVAAAAGLVLLLSGALAAHWRAGDEPAEAAPALAVLAVAVAYLVIAVNH